MEVWGKQKIEDRYIQILQAIYTDSPVTKTLRKDKENQYKERSKARTYDIHTILQTIHIIPSINNDQVKWVDKGTTTDRENLNHRRREFENYQSFAVIPLLSLDSCIQLCDSL